MKAPKPGGTICSMDAHQKELTESEIIQNMVGRKIENIYPKRPKKAPGEVVLELKDWTVEDPERGNREILHKVCINVRKGEIVGLQGLMGAGRTELALSIFGNVKGYRLLGGSLMINGKECRFRSPGDAIKNGLAYVSEDRKGNGLILIQDIRYNTTLANLQALVKRLSIDANKEIQIANEYKDSINIKAPSVEQKVGNLSGGNQQKVQLAKWMFAEPQVLILDEPTRGIDVGAKLEIYTLMNQLVERGMGVIMISSELPEVLGMSDRLYVMSEGTITGELSAEEATEQKVMALAIQS